MTELSQGTWIVVADGEKALFLRNKTDDEDPYFDVRDKDEQDNPKDIDQSANRPGRMPDPGPGQFSAMDDTDWHELAKERFAADLADKLYERVHAGKMERIVLVAAPKILGELRKNLHQEVEACVVGEIDKTLTNHPVTEIEDIVAAELAS
ncbi:host attachment family protein [Tropicimonas sp. S265A]|uniref:host attachment family protein n=1 Tax=Tropicimonas sp. S265A TaxID=3415134 RepID=UPI003C7B193F